MELSRWGSWALLAVTVAWFIQNGFNYVRKSGAAASASGVSVHWKHTVNAQICLLYRTVYFNRCRGLRSLLVLVDGLLWGLTWVLMGATASFAIAPWAMAKVSVAAMLLAVTLGFEMPILARRIAYACCACGCCAFTDVRQGRKITPATARTIGVVTVLGFLALEVPPLLFYTDATYNTSYGVGPSAHNPYSYVRYRLDLVDVVTRSSLEGVATHLNSGFKTDTITASCGTQGSVSMQVQHQWRSGGGANSDANEPTVSIVPGSISPAPSNQASAQGLAVGWCPLGASQCLRPFWDALIWPSCTLTPVIYQEQVTCKSS